jgi:hypothetical protein
MRKRVWPGICSDAATLLQRSCRQSKTTLFNLFSRPPDDLNMNCVLSSQTYLRKLNYHGQEWIKGLRSWKSNSRMVAAMTEDDPGVESEKVSDNILG